MSPRRRPFASLRIPAPGIGGGRLPFEACVWVGGLLVLALTDPEAPRWLRLCPFAHVGDWLGVHFCPGCGLGRSIGWLARGEVGRSFALHPLGLPAVAVLSARSVALVRAAWRRPRPTPPPSYFQP